MSVTISQDGTITWYAPEWSDRTTEVQLNPKGTLSTNGQPAQHLLGIGSDGELTFQITRRDDEIADWLHQPHIKARLGRLIPGPKVRKVSPSKARRLDDLLVAIRLRF